MEDYFRSALSKELAM